MQVILYSVNMISNCFLAGCALTQELITYMKQVYIYLYAHTHKNGMDLTEAENIKKRWQEYTEELYKKDFHEPDNHDGVITHLEPDILECEV